MIKNSRICRLMTSSEEAIPFINYYKMELQKQFNLFPIYSDSSKENWLVISGADNKQTSYALIYLKNCSESKLNTGWLNFGFGIMERKISNCYLIDKISNVNTNEILYPSIVNINLFERTEIVSVNKSSEKDFLFCDFNSFHFYKTINKYVNKELIYIIKISINKNQIFNNVLKKSLIRKNFEKIIELEKIIINYSQIESVSVNPPKYFCEIIKQLNFTTSEKFQLKSLLQSWNNLYSRNLIKDIKNIRKADLVLKFLKSDIQKGELTW